MDILIVAATGQEIAPTLEHLKVENSNTGDLFAANENISVLVTGVGMVATAYHLAKTLSNKKYDLLINVGIAGSFAKDIQLGEVVLVEVDIIADLGAQDKDDFLSAEELNLVRRGDVKFKSNPASLNQLSHLRVVKAITVNTVHGNKASIGKIVNRLRPDIETMEGAAFHYACEKSGVEGLQIRSISNYVEERNKDAWDIPLAIKNLNNELIKFVESLI